MKFDEQGIFSESPILALSSRDTEVSVLSVLINFPAVFDDVSDRIKPAFFSDALYRTVFVEICKQMVAGRGCDTVTIAEALTGVATLQEVHAIAASHDHGYRAIGRMVDTLSDRYKSRQLHTLSGKMATLAFETTPVQDRIDIAMSELTKLDNVEESDDWVGAHEASILHLDLLDARQNGRIKGMETGLSDFDELLDGGLHRGNLVVIGARPSMGKTALAMTIGLHMSQTYAVGFLSMEMPHNDVRDRQAAILSSASISHIKRPIKGLDYGRIVEGVERSKALKFYVSDKSGLNILQVRSKARSLKRRHGLDVLIVDYIGLMDGLDRKVSRAYQIEEISRGLKGLAKELDIVVICLAQVNRAAADKGNNPPGLHELRDSGAIEQDADVVAFIHRQIMANPDAGEDYKNYGLLRIAKNRQGRCADVHLFYQGEYTKFSNWSGSAPSKSLSPPSKGRGFSHDD
jgi:replicative DNA helicase